MLKFHAIGEWVPGQVSISWTACSRRIVSEVERRIEQAWAASSAALGRRLFDGPMCRLESWQARQGELRLNLSRTSYKPFLGTNLKNPEVADEYGHDVLANPVGVSTVLETPDGYLLFGRRNDQVAYYPNRVHPFAGALEPREGLDVFDEVYRELEEELALGRGEVEGLCCLGLVEDQALRQPELIVAVRSRIVRGAIESRVDEAEHESSWPVPAERGEVERALRRAELTPVAVASLLLWGRRAVGAGWFEANRGEFGR